MCMQYLFNALNDGSNVRLVLDDVNVLKHGRIDRVVGAEEDSYEVRILLEHHVV